MTTIALFRPRNALLDRLRTILIGVGARGSIGAGLAAKASLAASGNGLLNSLIAYWPLNEAAGANNALDLHTNGLTLTQVSSPGADTGKVYSTARTFDGSADYFVRAATPALQCGDVDFTLSAWVFLSAKSTYNHIVSSHSGIEENYLLRFQGGATGKFLFEVRAGAGYPGVEATSFGSPSLNTWIFLVAWHDAVNNQLAIQVNGGTVDTFSHSGGLLESTAYKLFVGAQYEGGLFFNGRIGPVAFWKSSAGAGGVLSSAQRLALWSSGNGLAYSAFTT